MLASSMTGLNVRARSKSVRAAAVHGIAVDFVAIFVVDDEALVHDEPAGGASVASVRR